MMTSMLFGCLSFFDTELVGGGMNFLWPVQEGV
jgi:hypothetical protein